MAVPENVCASSDSLVRAAQAGDLVPMACAEAASCRYMLRAVCPSKTAHVMTPFGHLGPGIPYEAYIPPA